MLDKVASELFLINACSSGKFENVKWFLTKMLKYICGVPKAIEEEKKEKTWKLPMIHTGHLIGRGKSGKLCGTSMQYYVEVSDDYVEKTPDYAEICKINKVVPWAFSNT